MDAINGSQLGILNDDSPTRLSSNGPKSSPDLSICSAHLSTVLNWQPLTTLNSDHLPILVSFPDPDKRQPRQVKTYFNFKKADWDSFTTESEQLFSSHSQTPLPARLAKNPSAKLSSQPLNIPSQLVFAEICP